MDTKNAFALILGCSAIVAAADADVLDRLKRKLNDAESAARDVQNDAASVTQADERIESTANGAVPNTGQLENRAAAEVASTDEVRAVRDAERDANAVATADERAQATVQGEISAAENEVQRTLDVEARARDEVNRTDPAIAAREAERDVNAVLTTDERAKLELERERAEIERATELE